MCLYKNPIVHSQFKLNVILWMEDSGFPRRVVAVRCLTWMIKWMDGWTDGWMYGWRIDGLIDFVQMCIILVCRLHNCAPSSGKINGMNQSISHWLNEWTDRVYSSKRICRTQECAPSWRQQGEHPDIWKMRREGWSTHRYTTTLPCEHTHTHTHTHTHAGYGGYGCAVPHAVRHSAEQS